MIKKLYFILIKFVLKIYNYSYRIASILVKKLEKDHLHPKHRIMNYHQFFVDNIEIGDKILDLGCGNGALTYDAAKKANRVIGIDLSKKNIQIANAKYGRENIKYIVGDATKDLSSEKFDAIILSNVLEHIEDRLAFLESIKHLAPKILIRVPMINRDWVALYKKELGVEWRLDNSHYIEYTLEGLQQELKKTGLRIINYSVQFGEIWAIINSIQPAS